MKITNLRSARKNDVIALRMRKNNIILTSSQQYDVNYYVSGVENLKLKNHSWVSAHLFVIIWKIWCSTIILFHAIKQVGQVEQNKMPRRWNWICTLWWWWRWWCFLLLLLFENLEIYHESNGETMMWRVQIVHSARILKENTKIYTMISINHVTHQNNGAYALKFCIQLKFISKIIADRLLFQTEIWFSPKKPKHLFVKLYIILLLYKSHWQKELEEDINSVCLCVWIHFACVTKYKRHCNDSDVLCHTGRQTEKIVRFS